MGSNGEPQGVSSKDRDINVSSSWPVETSSFWRPPLHDPTFLAHIILPDLMPPSHVFPVSQPPQPFRYPPHDNLYRSRTRRGDYVSVGRRHQSYHRNSFGRQTLNPRSFAVPSADNPLRHVSYDTSASLSPLRLSRRPRTWRGAYKSPSKGGLLSRLSSFLARNPAFNRTRIRLNPLISHRPYRTELAVIYNMRFEPLPHLGVHFLKRPATTFDYYQLATPPPVDRLTVWHPKLPWYIKVRASTPNGVTVHDVLFGIYTQLRRPICQDEYYTEALTARDRELLGLAFEERCAGDLREISGGVRRVDFFGGEVGFVGLVRSRKGVWEMKAVAPEQRRMMMS
ncbi:hypothetical protein M413DRAFT_448669 [Hebeloma cylindrosporum]|uniref:DUF6699 domain-containing protein n=1 Tax=Hebeloma cylindrosporum TaxID=76867 RepID=A0A0C3BYQ5_HEBCY|nr:hypothetical protein M413DRAFT_448669 [Hebeloma cylindrosporum h7]